jgi:hypothetical protein
MPDPNPDDWALTHMRRLALSRWDNEGGASAFRPTARLSESSHPRRRNPGSWVSAPRAHGLAVVLGRCTELIEPAMRGGPPRARPE